MYRNSSSPAARQSRAAASKRNWGNSLLISEGAAGPCVSLVTGEVIAPTPKPAVKQKHRRRKRRQHLKPRVTKIRWPIYVTEPSEDGSIITRVLRSRSDADEQGFSWIGR